MHIAFCDPAPDAFLEENNIEEKQDNQELGSAGQNFTEMFLSQFTKVAFPILPSSARKSIEKYFLQPSNVAHVAKNLGYEVPIVYTFKLLKEVVSLRGVYKCAPNLRCSK